jgi:hypothetical protein
MSKLPLSFDQQDFVPLDAFLVLGENGVLTLKDCYNWILSEWSNYPNYILWDYTIMPYKQDEYNVSAIWLNPFYKQYAKTYAAFPNT